MADCEVAFDHLTRQLYATGASHCQIEPASVAFPRSAAQASTVIRAAAQDALSLIPRRAGTEECRPCSWMNEAFRDQRAETCLKGNGGLRAHILNDGILKREA
jgi:hypothetical protein